MIVVKLRVQGLSDSVPPAWLMAQTFFVMAALDLPKISLQIEFYLQMKQRYLWNYFSGGGGRYAAPNITLATASPPPTLTKVYTGRVPQHGGYRTQIMPTPKYTLFNLLSFVYLQLLHECCIYNRLTRSQNISSTSNLDLFRENSTVAL